MGANPDQGQEMRNYHDRMKHEEWVATHRPASSGGGGGGGGGCLILLVGLVLFSVAGSAMALWS